MAFSSIRSRTVHRLMVLALVAMTVAACGDDETPVQPAPTPSGPTIFGNGSAGSVTISSDTLLAEPNLQFKNFTVESGVTLEVESGTVIRCTGTFQNDGTIVVFTSARGSLQSGFIGIDDGSYAPAEAGVALRAPSPGELGPSTSTRAGGQAGIGVSEYQARMLLRPGPKAGSGSGGSFAVQGASGGGSLVVLAKSSITNNGTITADGANAGSRSGGGGGIVVLGSTGSVTNSGTISATGGNGGNNDTFAGRGGGGGGGIIHFLAPTVTEGTTDVSGGVGGVASGTVSSDPRQGGGGGGACGGNGGVGGSVSSSDTPNAAGAGSAGYALTTIANPTSLFMARWQPPAER